MDLTERREGVSRHPWEVQRFEAYRRVLADQGALGAMRVLDVGAGDGWFSDQLASVLPGEASTVCWDVNYADSDLEPSRPGVSRTRTPPVAFDPSLVLVLDVLEHIERPDAFIGDELAPLVSSGTPVLVAVPAYQWLFGAHDVALHHHRRYGRRRLLAELDGWLEITEHGSLFTSLLLPRAVQVGLERLRRTDTSAAAHGVGAWERGPTLTAAVNAVLSCDARVGRRLGRMRLRLPGLSHWAFGRAR